MSGTNQHDSHFLVVNSYLIVFRSCRGGSELGKDWYREGKLENKMNSFKDFICAAEHLVQNKFTSPEYLSAMGTSAGGLLVGRAIIYVNILRSSLPHCKIE